MIVNKDIPKQSKYKNFIESVGFFDSYTLELKKDTDIKELYIKWITHSPKWVVPLMKLRNKIVKLFGLSVVENTSKEFDFTINKKLGIFTLYYLDDSEIISGEKDTHLDFCISFLKEGNTITISTIVSYNNRLGKIYFFFVKPFHSFIVKSMIKNYIS